ncbi:MAG: bifunctional phosphoribosylaminoimidazolecarboxamide formyltransferase/IMP cyclohydrolase [Deltaproteobacteria bacterium]|nr:bifunctional phosphoribosylaminoimidazolecarboxamide formyltransferase/IMP cyclohydrolase [Deltaproteobacteria bacterium]
MKTKRALISVSDKTGVVEFAQEIDKLGFEIISTGGTAKSLRAAGVNVKDISEVTGFPEIMDGRVKTLHPLIHGGILARRDHSDHLKAVEQQKIPLIDLIVVNLYPFMEVTKDENVTLETAIENIDIGGPTMIRAAAKNYQHVAVVIEPEDYGWVLEQIKATGEVGLKDRAKLAVKVFHLMSRYDATVDTYLSRHLLKEERVHFSYGKGVALRYGENNHQEATFYKDPDSTESSVANGEVLHGKAMSYNNYVDANAAYEAVKDLPAGICAVSVIKHTNPCGLATGSNVAEALQMAWEGDPISSFGGVIASNTKIDMAFAQFLKGDQVKHISYQVINGEYIPQEVPTGKFVEVVIAPDFDHEAVEFLKQKSKMIRLVKVGSTLEQDKRTFRTITGGLLIQTPDKRLMDGFKVVTKMDFPEAIKSLAEFTLVACKHTKSNAIVLGREYQAGKFHVIGMGAGQPNRVDSMRKLAIPKAKENLKREFELRNISGSFDDYWKEEVSKMVLVSDGFFPFDDTVREASLFGIRYLVQPGGSLRDEDSIKACDELSMAMACSGLRHFNH